jgi:predicted RNase H-like HicB family nuclease
MLGAMKREFTVVVEQGEDGFLVGSAPALPGCYTQGATMPELLERMREAIELCLSEMEDGDSVQDLPIVSVLKVAV